MSSFIIATENVTASITVQRRRYGVWVDAGTLIQQAPGVITAQTSPVYATERGSLSNSLNFIIPASEMRGKMRLKVQVESPGAHKDESFVEVDAILKQTLRVRGIPVRYWGPDTAGNPVQLGPTTITDFQKAAATSLSLFPVAQTPDISLAGIFTWDKPLTGNMSKGVCPESWINILFWLNIAKIIDGNKTDRLYYALLPSGIPLGDTGGCGDGGGAGTGFIGDGMAMAHELGHVLNLSHAPGCLPKDDNRFDPNYPAYEPYDTAMNKRASIGEYGLDPTTGDIYSPVTTSDFMSYCGSKWISLYHYKALIENPLLDPYLLPGNKEELPPLDEQYRNPPRILDPTPPWLGRRLYEKIEINPESVILVSGFIRNGEIEIASVIRLKTRRIPSGNNLEGTMAELLDANNRVIQRGALQWKLSQPCGCGCDGHEQDNDPYGIIQVMLPDNNEGITLRITRNKEEVWVRRASGNPPSIYNLSAVLENENLLIRWQTSLSDESNAERFVRYSYDDGINWDMLAIGLKEDRAVVPVSGLLPGNILIEVSVSDGFYTSSERTRAEIPQQPGTVAILWPVEGSTVRSDTTIRCWGAATGSDGKPIPSSSLHWELNGERIGEGTEHWEVLPVWEGEHCLKLKAMDGNREYSASVKFLATSSGRRPYFRRDEGC